MEKYQGINRLRRRVMHALTGKLGNDHGRLPAIENVKKVLIVRPNSRLGNMLLLTPLLREVLTVLPDARVDLFIKGTNASRVFKEFTQVDRIISLPERPFSNLYAYGCRWLNLRQKKYDLVINVDPGSSSGRLATRFARASAKLFGESGESRSTLYPDAAHMAKGPVYRFREFLSRHGLQPRNARIPELSLCLTPEEIRQGHHKLREIIRNDNPVICLFTYATGQKDFGREWWRPMLAMLREEIPGVNFVELLPAHGASAVDYKIPSIFSRNIREMAGVMANCRVFIGADSGIMHLASASGIPTIGLFRVSRKEKYAPFNRESLGIDMNLHDRADVIRQVRRILGPKAMLTPGAALMREIAN